MTQADRCGPDFGRSGPSADQKFELGQMWPKLGQLLSNVVQIKQDLVQMIGRCRSGPDADQRFELGHICPKLGHCLSNVVQIEQDSVQIGQRWSKIGTILAKSGRTLVASWPCQAQIRQDMANAGQFGLKLAEVRLARQRLDDVRTPFGQRRTSPSVNVR